MGNSWRFRRLHKSEDKFSLILTRKCQVSLVTFKITSSLFLCTGLPIMFLFLIYFVFFFCLKFTELLKSVKLCLISYLVDLQLLFPLLFFLNLCSFLAQICVSNVYLLDFSYWSHVPKFPYIFSNFLLLT